MPLRIHVDIHPFNGETYFSLKKILTSHHKPVFLWRGEKNPRDWLIQIQCAGSVSGTVLNTLIYLLI